MAILTGRLGDGASVRVTYPAAVRSSSRIRCTHTSMSALVAGSLHELLGQLPGGPRHVSWLVNQLRCWSVIVGKGIGGGRSG